jgi:hypothetical protein
VNLVVTFLRRTPKPDDLTDKESVLTWLNVAGDVACASMRVVGSAPWSRRAQMLARAT